ncbi:hypothetical protein RJ640_008690 [Escallonia rubra]|uniref:Uncharacterized protein n=1 Tax=Escallonia rubra TaxID=112253 RepID=A0AA88R377_9ASTE|nr:hypothetical protein RJ640_008690 [Escallonia rubra]
MFMLKGKETRNNNSIYGSTQLLPSTPTQLFGTHNVSYSWWITVP